MAREKRLSVEREAKEKEERAKTEAASRSAAETAKAKLLEDREKKARALEVGNATRTEWTKWVDKQKWMKKEVIDVVKADKALRGQLKVGIRLITRGLGQVVNTRESIQRVVGHSPKFCWISLNHFCRLKISTRYSSRNSHSHLHRLNLLFCPCLRQSATLTCCPTAPKP